jgi:hypothetical protein
MPFQHCITSTAFQHRVNSSKGNRPCAEAGVQEQRNIHPGSSLPQNKPKLYSSLGLFFHRLSGYGTVGMTES